MRAVLNMERLERIVSKLAEASRVDIEAWERAANISGRREELGCLR